jgi:hypothetical protein
VTGNQLGPDKRHLTERIVEKNLVKYVSERQARKYSNEGDRIQQDSASITAKKPGTRLFNNRGLKGKGLLSSYCDF